jgi:hypothetical protein
MLVSRRTGRTSAGRPDPSAPRAGAQGLRLWGPAEVLATLYADRGSNLDLFVCSEIINPRDFLVGV